MMRPKKRSLTIRGHRTSVSLEDPFWDALRDIAATRGMPVNRLTAEIDAVRGNNSGLASAIRLYILDYYRHPQSRMDSAQIQPRASSG